MIEKMSGKVWKYGDNINTDVIFPGKYTYQKMEPEEMAKHALEDLDPEFAKKVGQGDILVAGSNFGMGSSREQAAVAIRAAGIRVIIAKSFARIYFRNAINAGMPAINIDLIFSIPGQSLGDWRGTLEKTVALEPDHISAYYLTYEEDTPFFEQLTAGRHRDEPERNAAMFGLAHRFLTEENFSVPLQPESHL